MAGIVHRICVCLGGHVRCTAWCWLGVVLLSLTLLPQSAAASPQMVVHLLDYVAVDYPEFVRAGRVLDAAEYEEQREFARQAIELLRASPDNAERAQLLDSAAVLAQRIDAKAPGEEITRLARALRWRVIEAYGLSATLQQAPDPALGASLYARHCATCHGADGRGDGPAGKGLDPAPSSFHDHTRMAQRSLYGLYSTITLGVAGTGMASYRQLSEEERWALAFHVGAMGTDPQQAARGEQIWAGGAGREQLGTLRALATLTDAEVAQQHGADVAAVFAWLKRNPQALAEAKESPIAYARRALAESVAAYRAGKPAEANRLALAAYLQGFELAEPSLDAIAPEMRRQVESAMIGQRDLMRRGAAPEAVADAASKVDALLARSAELLEGPGLSPTAAAFSAFVILLREGLEALLVVAAIVALLVKAGRRDALPWIHLGWVGALAAGAVTWFAASTVIEVSGATRELTEGITALLAAAILLYVGLWLHRKRHVQAWQAYIDSRLSGALARGTLFALAGVSFLAVYREAFETVLFYQALWQQAGARGQGSILVGFGCAVAALAVIAWLILRYGLRLPLGRFFTATALLLAALAVVFTGHGLRALQEAGAAPATPFGHFGVPALGLYPTAETIAAQLVVLALVAYWFLAGARRPS